MILFEDKVFIRKLLQIEHNVIGTETSQRKENLLNHMVYTVGRTVYFRQTNAVNHWTNSVGGCAAVAFDLEKPRMWKALNASTLYNGNADSLLCLSCIGHASRIDIH